MSIQGTLETMSLSDLLQFLGAGRKSGTLKFDRGKISKQIYFQNGLIVGSRSNDPREYLGQVLLHYGKVDESQLQLAREAQRRSGVLLGEALSPATIGAVAILVKVKLSLPPVTVPLLK